jgi:hypothetical protein
MAKWAVSGESAQDTTHLVVPGSTRHERRVVFGPYPPPVVLTRPQHDYFFILQKIIYTYVQFIFNIINIIA